MIMNAPLMKVRISSGMSHALTQKAKSLGMTKNNLIKAILDDAMDDITHGKLDLDKLMSKPDPGIGKY